MHFRITSPVFADGAAIPVRHTCDGADVSPRLTWTGAPEGTRAFALIMDDADAPHGTFTHWIVYDIPAETIELGEGAAMLIEGRNSFGRTGYAGPCPPAGHGAHRYRFTLYALDVPTVALSGGATREELESKIETHTIATARLVGKYERQPVPTGALRI